MRAADLGWAASVCAEAAPRFIGFAAIEAACEALGGNRPGELEPSRGPVAPEVRRSLDVLRGGSAATGAGVLAGGGVSPHPEVRASAIFAFESSETSRQSAAPSAAPVADPYLDWLIAMKQALNSLRRNEVPSLYRLIQRALAEAEAQRTAWSDWTRTASLRMDRGNAEILVRFGLYVQCLSKRDSACDHLRKRAAEGYATEPLSQPPLDPSASLAALMLHLERQEDLDCALSHVEDALLLHLMHRRTRDTPPRTAEPTTRTRRLGVIRAGLSTEVLASSATSKEVVRPLATIEALRTVLETTNFTLEVDGGFGYLAGNLGADVRASDRFRLDTGVALGWKSAGATGSPFEARLRLGLEHVPYLKTEDPDQSSGRVRLQLDLTPWGLGHGFHPSIRTWASRSLDGGSTRAGGSASLGYAFP